MKPALLTLLIVSSLHAALPVGPTLNWEVRQSGLSTNGGGYVSGLGGTDFSMQNAPQVAFTDLLVGTPNTTVTSVAHPFGATFQGNIINITSGTGYTPGRYVVQSVVGVVATLDRSPGATGSSGGTGGLGGGFALPSQANSVAVAGNIINIQNGTYTFAASMSILVSSSWVGYNVTHGDKPPSGSRPLITTATDSTILIKVSNGINFLTLDSINFNNTATTRAIGIQGITSAVQNVFIIDCTMAGFTVAIDTNGNMLSLRLMRTEIAGQISHGVKLTASTGMFMSFDGCYIHGNGGSGILIAGQVTNTVLVNSIVSANSDSGITVSAGTQSSLYLFSTAVALNTGDGINNASTVTNNGAVIGVTNSIFWGNTSYNIEFPGTIQGQNVITGLNNAYGGAGTANFLNVAGSPGDIALGATPFATATNFALNSTANGGALLKATGYPGTFGGGTTVGFLDVGPAQSQCAVRICGAGFVGDN